MKSPELKPAATSTCVCCGYETLIIKSKSICKVCRWESDGHDNATAFRYSSSNQTNLNLARYEFLQTRTSNPACKRTRFFSVDETGSFIEERSKAGKVLYRGPIPFVEYAPHGKGVIAAIPIPQTNQRKSRRSA